MNDQNRLTPISHWREVLVRWANDTAWGERLARWVGKTAGGLQLRLEKIRPSSDIPWAPLSRPLSEAMVALVSTAGVHLCSDTPFDLETDASFRMITRTASNTELCLTHEHYDRRDAVRDPNLIFPLERLLELETEGEISRVADVHYGFGFTALPHQKSLFPRVPKPISCLSLCMYSVKLYLCLTPLVHKTEMYSTTWNHKDIS